MQEIVHQICQKEGLDGRDIQPLSGGQVNSVFLVDGQYVVRIGARPDAYQRLKRETALLQSLAGAIPVPRVYAFGQHAGRVYQVQQRLPGVKLYAIWKELSPQVQEAVVAELCAIMKILHQRAAPFFGEAHDDSPQYAAWPAFLEATFRRTLAEIDALHIRMAPGFLALAERCFAQHAHVLQQGTPVLVHSDLTLVNVLVDGGKISAVLDFEYALQAPRDYELWAMEAFCLYPNDWAEAGNERFCSADFASFFNLLRRHYPELFETPDLRQRMDLYHLGAALGSYLAWRKDNLATLPPERMAAKEFYMARISNFIFDHGARMFL